jgi:murein DD-endopeptidase MepM/ murein hydrolase activator NlpD
MRWLAVLALAACEPAPRALDKEIGSTGSSMSSSPAIAVVSSTAVIGPAQTGTKTSPPIGAEIPAAAGNASNLSGADPDLQALQRELMIPVSGVLADELRDTFTDARGEGRVHDAIDIPAPRGTHVLSASRGRVLKLFTSKAGGLMVYAADSSERFILLYGHLDGYAPGMADGAELSRGQTIGFVGTTGNAPPDLPHLHFAIARSENISQWWKGTAVNPYPLLKNK